ncbi:MAG TPA: hypothetical protein PLQ21_11235, partial [Candidatus Kapabacteria bacterium]|nr:hypothetical protein [Candidatus Kapabacteria bacterium]
NENHIEGYACPYDENKNILCDERNNYFCIDLQHKHPQDNQQHYDIQYSTLSFCRIGILVGIMLTVPTTSRNLL